MYITDNDLIGLSTERFSLIVDQAIEQKSTKLNCSNHFYFPKVPEYIFNISDSLTEIDFRGNSCLEDIEILNTPNRFNNLKFLNLSGCGFKKGINLKNLKSLEMLNLENNELNCEELKLPLDLSALSIAGCPLYYFEILRLSYLKNLDILLLQNTKLRSIKGISCFNKLTTLYLDNCLLFDIKELENLPSLKTVSLADNPFNLNEKDICYKTIQFLRDKGCHVNLDSREVYNVN